MKIVDAFKFFLPVLLLLGSLLISGAAAQEERGGSLTVVELFTSQACPHSPAGDNNLALLAARKDILALTFPVTYWDYLGWADTFARESFTVRQKNYIMQMPDQWLYTPQMVVQGRIGVNGDDMAVVQQTIEGIAVTLDNSISLMVRAIDEAQEVTIQAQKLSDMATLSFVAWEPGPITVEVTAGKNTGKVLDYVNVVRSLIQVDELAPASATSVLVDIPEEAKNLPCAFLLQDKGTGSVIAAALCK